MLTAFDVITGETHSPVRTIFMLCGCREATSPGDALCRTPGHSHVAQPAEPPCADRIYGGVGGEDGRLSAYPDFKETAERDFQRKTAAESFALRHELYCGCGCEGVCGGGDCGLWPPNPWLPPVPNELCPNPPCPGIPPGIPGVPGVTAPGIPAVTPPVGFTGPVSKPPRSAMGR